MKSRDFIYWLQGYLELSGKPTFNKQQLAIVIEHLTIIEDKHSLASDEKSFLAYTYGWAASWYNKLGWAHTVPQAEMDDFKVKLQARFHKVTGIDDVAEPVALDPQAHLRVSPALAYEPLGDIYNNQRIC